MINYAYIGIGSVSADMKKRLSVMYRIGRFKKWHLSVDIGIGRYEKKLIGRTQNLVMGTYIVFKKSVNIDLRQGHLKLN